MFELPETGRMVLGCILGFSIAAWTAAIYEWQRLRAYDRNDGDWLGRASEHVRQRDSSAALAAVVDRGSLFADLVSCAAVLGRVEPDGRQRQMSVLIESTALTFATPLSLVAYLASSLPLLGLLGTVLGMIETFDAMTAMRAADTSGFADGISTALVTTQAGLVASLPILVMHGYLKSRARDLINRAQVVARQLESVSGEK
jgi:biopolymer transport protein ExbB/TolQ